MERGKVTNDRSSDEGTLNGSAHHEKTHASKLAALERPAPGQQGATQHRNALDAELFPEDSFVQQADGSFAFWGDLPAGERRAFMFGQFGDLTRREWGLTWQQFKADPLLPAILYWKRYALPGMGLFTEGFVIFSIGNVKTLFNSVWPQCWKTGAVCIIQSVEATDYLGVAGIIIGQCLVGYEADYVGRRFGMIQDALVMLIGTLLLTGVWGAGGSLQGWIAGYAVAQFVYGLGVGGEYPITATTSMEAASSARTNPIDRLYRGRRVTGAFLMQGWGQVANLIVLMLGLLIYNGSPSPPYSTSAAQATYRGSFGFIAVLILWLLYYRVYRKRDADKALNRAKGKAAVSGYDLESASMAIKFFWPRLLATTWGWFANDFLFYGAKIFASTFIPIVTGEASPTVMTVWKWNLLNVFIALVGYYAGWLLIDARWYGRRTMQNVGFGVCTVIFIICAAAFPQLQQNGAPIHVFQWLYFMSSFFQQFGPNIVTFLVAAEVYPASIRGSAHGISAAVGKIGALVPTIAYSYVSNRTKFAISAAFGLVGLLVTWLFLPDTTGLDLHEQERRWALIRDGRGHEYHGIAIHPIHLSWWEIHVQKQHLNYDPAKDRAQRVNELRVAHEREAAMLAEEKRGKLGTDVEEHDYEISPELARYFETEKQLEKEDPHALREIPSGRLGDARIGQALH